MALDISALGALYFLEPRVVVTEKPRVIDDDEHDDPHMLDCSIRSETPRGTANPDVGEAITADLIAIAKPPASGPGGQKR